MPKPAPAVSTATIMMSNRQRLVAPPTLSLCPHCRHFRHARIPTRSSSSTSNHIRILSKFVNSIFGSKRKRERYFPSYSELFFFFFLILSLVRFYVKMFWIKKKKKKGFRVGYGYPWIIYSGKIWVWILMGIDNRVSMGKLFGQGMGIPDPYPTHGHP